jgi:hypothetical protein
LYWLFFKAETKKAPKKGGKCQPNPIAFPFKSFTFLKNIENIHTHIFQLKGGDTGSVGYFRLLHKIVAKKPLEFFKSHASLWLSGTPPFDGKSAPKSNNNKDGTCRNKIAQPLTSPITPSSHSVSFFRKLPLFLRVKVN